MRTISIAILTALAAATLPAAPSQASGRVDRCTPAVEEELSRLQVGADRVGAISLQIRSHNDRDDDTRVIGVLGWVELTDCRGRLVVDMTPRCRVKQSYTTGACSVPGVPAF